MIIEHRSTSCECLRNIPNGAQSFERWNLEDGSLRGTFGETRPHTEAVILDLEDCITLSPNALTVLHKDLQYFSPGKALVRMCLQPKQLLQDDFDVDLCA
jgi:hypothetical protein